MKIKIGAFLALIVGSLADSDCPVDREQKCVDDFRVALPYCVKAAEAQGKDVPADINCLKYFHTMEQDCWPCICYLADKEKVTIKGC